MENPPPIQPESSWEPPSHSFYVVVGFAVYFNPVIEHCNQLPSDVEVTYLSPHHHQVRPDGDPYANDALNGECAFSHIEKTSELWGNSHSENGYDILAGGLDAARTSSGSTCFEWPCALEEDSGTGDGFEDGERRSLIGKKWIHTDDLNGRAHLRRRRRRGGGGLKRFKKMQHGNDCTLFSRNSEIVAVGRDILRMSFDVSGCRRVQDFIKDASVDPLFILESVEVLRSHVGDLVKSPNGNHVLSAIVERFGNGEPFVARECMSRVASIAMHPYGCRVIIRLVRLSMKAQTTKDLVDEILAHADILLRGRFSCYVMEAVLLHGQSRDLDRIGEIMRTEFSNLVRYKGGCYILEKAILLYKDTFTAAIENTSKVSPDLRMKELGLFSEKIRTHIDETTGAIKLLASSRYARFVLKALKAVS